MKIFAKCILLFVSVVCLLFVTNKSYSTEKTWSIPVGVTYNSIYWWRGIELNGKGTGVFWPKVGLEISDITAYVTAGINQDYLMATEKSDNDAAATYHEFDYGIEYAYSSDSASGIMGVKYSHYPFYDSAGGTFDPSFFEVYAIVSIEAFVTPVFELYYDYYVEENNAHNPVNEDIYGKLSFFKNLLQADSFIFKTGIWVGYYNNAYLDRKGFSDAGITFSTSYDVGGVFFFSAANYARTLSNDFFIKYDFDANGKSSKLKNHLWADFGVSTKL